ncbi:unnamed protein product [Cuscuta europaea]|uniref:Uncharacterized protein n=1 Tax=Cuscuta europaea TaxID=41803 RepID=A0A9P0ZUV3_CUSEU|nr:unnamed protein product [Cuscuta europaea]
MKFLKQEDTIMCRNLLRVFCHEIIRKKRWILIYLKSSARKSSEKGDCYFFLQIVLLFLGSSLPKSSRLNLSSRINKLKVYICLNSPGGLSFLPLHNVWDNA